MRFLSRGGCATLYQDDEGRVHKVIKNNLICNNEERILKLLEGTVSIPLLLGREKETLLLEYISGPTLRELGRVTEEMGMDYLIQLLKIQRELVNYQIVHNDISLANVIVTSSGLKLIDFGLSYLVTDTSVELCGNLHSFSPEKAQQVGDKKRLIPTEKDFAIDLWSIGSIIYELLYGRLPVNVRSLKMKKALARIAVFSAEHLELDVKYERINLILKLLLVPNPERRLENAQLILP